MRILNEMNETHDGGESFSGDISTFDRLKKTALALNANAEKAIFERFGVKGIQLDNVEQLYNPMVSGLGSIH